MTSGMMGVGDASAAIVGQVLHSDSWDGGGRGCFSSSTRASSSQ